MPSTNHARAPGGPYETDAPGAESICTATSEALDHSEAELPRRARKTQAGVDCADVVLIREVVSVQCGHEVPVLLGELRVDDFACFVQVVARAMLDLRGPLFG